MSDATISPAATVEDAPESIVSVDQLSVSYLVGRTRSQVLHDVTLAVAAREIVAIVGESGSGKSTMANAVAAMLPGNSVVTGGTLLFRELEIARLGAKQLRAVRGKRIGMIPQDPMSSLNPTQKIGVQVAEPLLLHKLETRRSVGPRVLKLLLEAGLVDPEKIVDSYPHELSGGMKQRVLIAVAFAAEPELIIADEPTSALDVTVAKRVMDHLEQLVRERRTALLLITHDLALAAHRADRIVVMKRGEVVEEGIAARVIDSPSHPYAKELLVNAPHLRTRVGAPTVSERPRVDPSAFSVANTDALLRVDGLVKRFTARGRNGHEILAVDDVSFAIPAGRTMAIVGESGSGKSTTARMVLRLEDTTAGSITFQGEDITHRKGEELRLLRQRIQVVYQSPFASLDPRMSLAAIVEEPLRAFGVGSRRERAMRVTELLDAVGIPATYARRRPVELSGGQRQRVAIARALALSPALVICDEPVSALDVLVQAQVLRLLQDLQDDFGVAYLFISHDLAVVREFADHVGIMSRGRMVEAGATRDVFAAPRDPYTKTLLDSAFAL